MSQEKIGKFIKELREEKNLTQEGLAELLFVDRTAISKWENGKNLPDTIILKELSKIFNISINELLMGKKEVNELATLKLYDNQLKLNKRIKIGMGLFFTLILLFLTYYFFSHYKSIKVYDITGNGNYATVTDGLFVETDSVLFFNLSNIKSDKKIDGLGLIYIDENKEEVLVIQDNVDKIIFSDYISKEEYLKNDIIEIINNMYLEIYYEDSSELLKLDFNINYINDKLVV